jgi:hypothetical protein
MTTDPDVAVPLARRLLLSGAWRTVPKQGDDTEKALYLLRVKLPAAWAVLPRSAVAGLTRQPPAGGCSWCVATVHAALSFGADPAPEPNPHTAAFLGSMCGRCQQRHRVAEVATRERAHVDQLVAAGLTPAAARRLRTPGQVQAQAAAIRKLEQARRPAATGIIWPAGQPQPVAVSAAVTAALRSRPPSPPTRFAWGHRGVPVAAARRGVPDPPYYVHHGRRGDPGGR